MLSCLSCHLLVQTADSLLMQCAREDQRVTAGLVMSMIDKHVRRSLQDDQEASSRMLSSLLTHLANPNTQCCRQLVSLACSMHMQSKLSWRQQRREQQLLKLSAARY